MDDQPWQGDACSLVEEFRRGERSPAEELEATYAAVDRSVLNAFCFLDRDRAHAAAAGADIAKPFGGVPIGVKELDIVDGWPATHASIAFKDDISTYSSLMIERLRVSGGAVLAGQTTASEFGGANVTRTKLHGTTRSPWDATRTPGGSSGGSAAAVAGGLCTLASGGDGGGSIRIPAGFCGLHGLKATFGRIPLGPRHLTGNYTVTVGCLARSVRDTARWFDVANGHDPRDPFSLPRVGGWEAGLGTFADALSGQRVAVVPDWGDATVSPHMWTTLDRAADDLIADAGLHRLSGVDTSLPSMGGAWSISGMSEIAALLGDRWPTCEEDLTPEIRYGLRATAGRDDAAGRSMIEQRRMEVNERMAAIFSEVDFVITASNPDVAFAADGPPPHTFGGIKAGGRNNGRLTFPANISGNPAVNIPAGLVDGLPVGLQVVGRHHQEQLLLELSWLAERHRPWPLVAPGSPS